MIRIDSDIAVAEKQLERIIDRLEDNMDVLVRDVSGEVLTSLTQDPLGSGGTGTPRDTLRATNGWNVSNGAAPDFSDGGRRLYPEPEDGQTAAERAIPKGSEQANIANGVPYILDLDQGTSQQAPAGFVRRATVRAVGFILSIRLLDRVR